MPAPTTSICGRRTRSRSKRDPESLKQALDLFQRAADKDPSFALAFAGIADTSLRLYNLTKDELFASQAQGAAEHARSLNDKLPEVHFALGSVYLARGNAAGAIAELERGANMAPNSDEGWRRLARAYEKQNRLAEAEVAYKKAIEANPYNWSTPQPPGRFLLGPRPLRESHKRLTNRSPNWSLRSPSAGATWPSLPAWRATTRVASRLRKRRTICSRTRLRIKTSRRPTTFCISIH